MSIDFQDIKSYTCIHFETCRSFQVIQRSNYKKMKSQNGNRLIFISFMFAYLVCKCLPSYYNIGWNYAIKKDSVLFIVKFIFIWITTNGNKKWSEIKT